jgi:hypothetical protein
LLNDYKTDREEKSLELYNNEGKTTRDIAKDVRMSLRDINIILKKHVVNHGIAIVDNKKSSNEKATLFTRLFSGTSGSKTPKVIFLSNDDDNKLSLVLEDDDGPSIVVNIYAINLLVRLAI